jgi:hypothetical protein
MSLVKAKNVDTSKISFSAPKSLDNGAKLVYVNYNDGRFSVQTPWMTMPWKMGVFTEGDYPKYSIDMSFRGMDENPDIKGFHDKFKELEQTIIDGGHKNCAAWLKKDPKTSKEVIEALFNPILKVSKDKESGMPDGKWPPIMKLKVPRRDGTWEFKLFDKDGTEYKINDTEEPVDVEELFVKNTRVRCIIQCVGLWIASGNYMCQWKVTRAEVDVPKTYSNDDFLSDSDDDGEVKMLADSDGEDGGVKMLADSDGEDCKNNGSDGEVEENEESQKEKSPSPEPEQKPAKKVVKKVKKVVRKNSD